MIRFERVKRFAYHPCTHQPERFAWWQPVIVRFARHQVARPIGEVPKWVGWNIWVYSPSRTWLGSIAFKVRK